MIANSPDMVVKLSLCSIKRQRQRRKLCCDFSARSVRPAICTPSSAASTLKSVVKRKARAACISNTSADSLLTFLVFFQLLVSVLATLHDR
jgi:hypothetical protein